MVLLIILVLASAPAIGAWYLMKGRGKSVDRLQGQVSRDVARRLGSIAGKVGGTVTDEPALETRAGKLTLYASKAPEIFVVDTAKFSAAVPGNVQMTIVRVEDAKKVVSIKGLIALQSAEPAEQQTHLFFASDEAFGRRCMEPKFVDLLRALDREAKGRCRVMLSRGTLSIVLARGLTKPEELEGFYKGCGEVAAGVKARSS